MGRPSKYTPKLAAKICARIAQGESVRSICAEESMPSEFTIYRWVFTNEEFSKQYAQAREIQAESFGDELREIVDDGRNDWMEIHDKDGECVGWRVNGEAVMRSRLRFDQRRWWMSKVLPKKYGDKIQQEISGKDGGPVVFTVAKIGEQKQ